MYVNVCYTRTMPQLVAMQFAAQSFGANINYTNRNAKSQITKWLDDSYFVNMFMSWHTCRQMATAFVCAASGATFASILLNSLLAVSNYYSRPYVLQPCLVIPN